MSLGDFVRGIKKNPTQMDACRTISSSHGFEMEVSLIHEVTLRRTYLRHTVNGGEKNSSVAISEV